MVSYRIPFVVSLSNHEQRLDLSTGSPFDRLRVNGRVFWTPSKV